MNEIKRELIKRQNRRNIIGLLMLAVVVGSGIYGAINGTVPYLFAGISVAVLWKANELL